MAEHTNTVLDMIEVERERQDDIWGEQNHGPTDWITILAEEVGEAAEEALGLRFGPGLYPGTSLQRYIKELTEVAATATAAIECELRRLE